MTRTLQSRLAAAALLAAVLFATAPSGARRETAFGRTSLEGSGIATMQSEILPANIARVAVVPGSKVSEAWAIGLSHARVPEWDSDSGTGQVVFLRYTSSTGWRMTGPPVSASGKVINPLLAAFALAPNGEGYAVGDQEALLHKAPGSTQWVQHKQSGKMSLAAEKQLMTSISLATSAGATVGYAVGVGPTIVRLNRGGVWEPVDSDPLMPVELAGVATVSEDEAWVTGTQEVGADSTKVMVFHRTNRAWEQVLAPRMFDNPPAEGMDGTTINRAAEAGAIAADATTMWIGGRMYPTSSTFPEGDGSPGHVSRAFMLRYDLREPPSGEPANENRWTSFCPDQYSEQFGGNDPNVEKGSGSQPGDRTKVCDEVFPTAPFAIASIQMLPRGEVFAGGLGLFHFIPGSSEVPGGWFREPNTNGYLISIAMGSNREGWVASPGNSLGAGGAVHSVSTTIGHWTDRPRKSAVARWSQPNPRLLQAVALEGGGTGRAIAVGNSGKSIIFKGNGWDSINEQAPYDLHAVDWPAGGRPFAVGNDGVIIRLDEQENWQIESGPFFEIPPTTRPLFGVAFRSPAEGVAVGLGGTIMARAGGRWRPDKSIRLGQDLYAIAKSGSEYVVVGSEGLVLEGVPGRWRVRPEGRTLLKRSNVPTAPTLYSATPNDKGEVVIGGQDGSILVRSPGGAIRLFETPLEGTILALTSRAGRLFASVSPDEKKYDGIKPAAMRGSILAFESGRWLDVSMNRRVTITLSLGAADPSAFDDPVYGLAMADGSTGWAAGGTPGGDVPDLEEKHQRRHDTSAIYRVNLNGDPGEGPRHAKLDAPPGGIAFAAFGESWCGIGSCTAAMGTGTQADLVSLQIRDEINEASTQPGGPRFVIFTGNMRLVGIPEELEEFRRYIEGFRIPVFSVVGDKDRFTTLGSSALAGNTKGFQEGPCSAIQGGSCSASVSSGGMDHWKQTFSGMTAPWGTSSDPRIKPVAYPPTATTHAGLARTHYAFDFKEGSRGVRVIVLDTSTKGYGTPKEQNPEENQGDFLKWAASSSDLPIVVAMNQPPKLPWEEIPSWTSDFEADAAANEVSVVVAGGLRGNTKDYVSGVAGSITVRIPLYIAGGGGGPLGYELPPPPYKTQPSLHPLDGYYHAWQLLTVTDDATGPLSGQKRVEVQAMPVLESVSMHSYRGTVIPAGQVTNMSAYARGLNGGFSDPRQSKTTYLSHGIETTASCGGSYHGNGSCISTSAVLPNFYFYSENPDVAEFVVPDPLGQGGPEISGAGNVVPDPGGGFGFLCTFKPGTAYINAVAGLQRHRLALTVAPTQGASPCTKTEYPPSPVPTPKPSIPASPEPEPPEPPITFSASRPPLVEIVAVFPPPPAPVVAPAPPGAPGVGRKEEQEVEYQTEKHDDHSFVDARYAEDVRQEARQVVVERRHADGRSASSAESAQRHAFTARRAHREDPVTNAWVALGALATLAFVGALGAAAVVQRRTRAVPVRTDTRW